MPSVSADAVLDAADTDAAELRRRLGQAGLAAVDLAVDTRRAPHRVLEIPRYVAMEQFFAVGGDAGRWMMCNTAALQVNISHDSQDPDLRWRQAYQLGPVLIAAFANSPGLDRAGRRWESLRQGIWWSVDPPRTRPPCVRKGMHQAWLEYALGADVMLVRDPSGHVHPVPPGLPFARWLAEGHITGYPTADDLRYHLTTLFPPIRPRGWLELRMLDALPSRLREVATIVATAALSPDAGAELARRLPPTAGLWCSAARYALAHPVLAEAARTLFDVVSCHLSHVGGDRSRRDAVHDYAERYVVRALAPAQLVSDDAFVNLFAPDLGTVMAVRSAV